MEPTDLDRDPLDHVRRNRVIWNGYAPSYAERAPSNWAAEPSWGIWGIPESEVHLLPEDLSGRDAVELGCGTGYVSAWLARLGARPVGVDLSDNQLATASAMQREFGLRYPLVQANAEQVPLRDGSFDLVISEYGAAIWCDPFRWIPEAARLLRPGGDLVFLGNGAILILCEPDVEADGPAGTNLIRDYFGMHRFEWPDEDAVEFHLPHGQWVRLLRANGFEVLELIELRPPADAESHYPFVTHDWARRWPSEEVWKARKVG
jgi:SAM-dependent methyltransferase